MRIFVVSIFLGCSLMSVNSDAAEPGTRELIQELGVALAWRLGPETIEETCRSFDPDGVVVRQQALKAWLEKNDAMIKEVDSRVADVVPALYPNAPGDAAVKAVRANIKTLLLESGFAEQSDDGKRDICKAEANPQSARWNNNGMPHVQQALAVLYDWKVKQGSK